jgi:hypothetical protein
LEETFHHGWNIFARIAIPIFLIGMVRTVMEGHASVFALAQIWIIEESVFQFFKQHQGRILSRVAQGVEKVAALLAGDKRIGYAVQDQKRGSLTVDIVNRVSELDFARRSTDGRAQQTRLERVRVAGRKHVTDGEGLCIGPDGRHRGTISIDLVEVRRSVSIDDCLDGRGEFSMLLT